MIPYRDSNPGLTTPIITVGLILVSVVTFFVMQRGGSDLEPLYEWSVVPCEITTGDPLDATEIQRNVCIAEPFGQAPFPEKSVPLSLFMAVVFHGGLIHLATNMLSLWIFGNNVEDALGRVVYPIFYLGAGAIAALSHVVVNPNSVLPLVGASGAIAAVMGVYLVIFPHARVYTLILPFFLVRIRAWMFLVIWFVSQFFLAGAETSIAWEAHVGGFAFGFVVGGLARRRLIDRLTRLRFPFGYESEPPPLPGRFR